MIDKINKNNNLISRFSCSLLGNGRKQSGHKIFLESLFLVRGNDEKKPFFLKSMIGGNREEKFQERKESQLNLFKFLMETGQSIKTLQNAIKRWNHQQEKGDHSDQSKETTRGNDYKKNISLSLLNKEELPFFDKKESSIHGKKKISNLSSRDLSKIPDSTVNKNKDSLKKKSSDLQSQTILQLSNKKFLEICKDNVKPIIETRNLRKGRVTYKVPLVTRAERQEGKAVSWLIDNASLRKKSAYTTHLPKVSASFLAAEGGEKEESSFKYQDRERVSDNLLLRKAIDDRKKNDRSIESCLASLLSDSFICKGESVDKRKEFHRIALKNRSYTSYRWW